MRINEVIQTPSATPENNLVTTLELLRYRYKDKRLTPKIKTDSLINLIRNTDRTFDYDTLVSAHDANPTVQNLIKSFNREEITLRPFGNEVDAAEPDDQVHPDAAQQPTNVVGNMAKKAARKRDSELF